MHFHLGRWLALLSAIWLFPWAGRATGQENGAAPSRQANEKPIFDPALWRRVAPENLLVMELENGRVAIALYPEIAPHSVARIKERVRAGFYDGLSFYRVVENFVAQAGIGEGSPAHRQQQPLKAEFTFPAERARPFTRVQAPETFAPETGFWRGLPVGRDAKHGWAWAIHCPGTFALARDADPDTSSSEFYITIGEAPRHLDRNLTVLGRVIAGLRFVQAAPRGDRDVNHGVIPDGQPRLRILHAWIAADLPEAERPVFHVMRTDTETFRQRIAAQRARENPFWVVRPKPYLDICTVPVPVRPIW